MHEARLEGRAQHERCIFARCMCDELRARTQWVNEADLEKQDLHSRLENVGGSPLQRRLVVIGDALSARDCDFRFKRSRWEAALALAARKEQHGRPAGFCSVTRADASSKTAACQQWMRLSSRPLSICLSEAASSPNRGFAPAQPSVFPRSSAHHRRWYRSVHRSSGIRRLLVRLFPLHPAPSLCPPPFCGPPPPALRPVPSSPPPAAFEDAPFSELRS